MRSYNQFCPVAKASEIFAERWTPLILRELLMGSRRFNELEQGLPRISRSLLSQRLRSLEQAGLIERRSLPDGRSPEYHPTLAGQELYGVIFQLGEWGQRWLNTPIGENDLDPELLMWDMRRRIHLDRVPERRIAVQFDFSGARTGSYWLVLDRREASVCKSFPGFDIDLYVHADTMTMHEIWIGRRSFESAMRNHLIRLEGERALVRDFPHWLALSVFSHVEPVETPLHD